MLFVQIIGAYIAGTVLLSVIAIRLAGSRAGSLFSFLVQCCGAYALAVIVDILRLEITGAVPWGENGYPLLTWTILLYTACAVAAKSSTSRLAFATPYWIFAAAEGVMGLIYPSDLIMAACIAAVGGFLYTFGPNQLGGPKSTPILVYSLTNVVGIVVAFVIAELVGLMFPAAKVAIFAALSIWWFYIGWRYASLQSLALGRRD